jgi:hypothetical protein
VRKPNEITPPASAIDFQRNANAHRELATPIKLSSDIIRRKKSSIRRKISLINYFAVLNFEQVVATFAILNRVTLSSTLRFDMEQREHGDAQKIDTLCEPALLGRDVNAPSFEKNTYALLSIE